MRAVSVLLPLFLVGCTNLNYQRAWNDSPPAETLTQVGTELRIVDARPKWERKPFNDAMSLYAVSAITPSLWEQLRVAVGETIAEVADKPERADVVVRSIQLVVKDSERLAAETERRHLFHVQLDDDAGFSGMLAYLFIGIPLEVFVNLPLEKRYPSELGKSPEGISCTIKADVTVVCPGGRKQSIPISVMSLADAQGGPQEPRDSLSETVRLTMLQVREQLRKGLGVQPSP
jgi:hypothetical protein